MKNLKKLLLLLCLIVAGVHSAWAEWEPNWQYCVYKGEFTSNDIVYYVYQTTYNNRVSSIKQINATGDVVIPYNAHLGGLTTLYSLGWWVDHEQVEDVNCEASMTSLTFDSRPQIHGNFTLQNLHGKLNLTGNYFDRVTYTRICSDATLNIPLATSLEFSRAKIEGTINAPSISALNLHEFSQVSGTINAVNATTAKIEGNISGTINIPKVTTAEMRYGTTISGTINADELTNVHIASSTNISGTINAPKATEVYMDFVDSFTGTINAPMATTITIRAGEGVKNSMYGTISSSQVTSINLGDVDFGTTGKLDCNHLTDIYIPNNYFVPNFTGPYTNHFTAAAHSITVHVYDMSAKQLAAMKNSSTWSGFKEIINHQSNVNYTISSEGDGRVTLYELNGSDDYAHCTNSSVKCMLLSGSRSGTIKAGGDYAVEVRDVDFATRKVRLYVNGINVPLMDGDDQNVPVKYANLQGVQTAQNIKVVISDKICKVVFTQEHLYTTPSQYYSTPNKHYATVTYRKQLDGETVIGNITGESATFYCAQGSELNISAPYDEYEPDSLLLNGNLRGMNYAFGRASRGFMLPTDDNEDEITFTVELRWKEVPKPTVIETPEGNTVNLEEHNQPQFLVMRSGEGEVVLKGMAHPENQHSIDIYEQDFNCTAQDGWVVSKVANCSQAVTTVTVPDYDLYYGDELDPETWGFVLEMTPLPGQTIRSLTLGWTDHSGDIKWEDMLNGDFASYTTYESSTNKYTMNVVGDYMNFGICDYFINVALGPPETAVETGKTLNFVRKGGRGHAWIYWHNTDWDFYFDNDGSSTKVIPNEQLTDLQMNVQLNEGESMHVYKNSEDITDQFQQRGSSDEFWAELEKESATYTLLIEESPDANPTWTIQNTTGNDVKVVTKYKNNTTGEETYSGTLNKVTFDDSKINMVTLEVYAENIDESKPVRILKNGVDVSYQFTVIDPKGDHLFLCYEVPVDVLMNCSWEISYNTDHKQTYIVRGGSRDPIFEVDHEILYNGPIHSVNQNEVPTSIYFAPFDNEYNSYIYTTVYVNDGETAKILRNGVDITNLFTIKTTNRERYYELEINDADFDGDNTLSAFGFDIREAAVWEITIEEAHKMLNAYANNDVIVSVAKLVEGEEPTFSGQANAMHRWINEGETYVVKFEPQHGEELTRFDIGWVQIDIAQDSRLVRNDDGSYSFTLHYGDMDESFDIMAVFGGERNIFVKTNGCAYTDVYVDGNLVAGFKNDTKTFVVSPGTTFQIKPFVDNDMVKKVMLNGTDVTNDVNYLRQKEETQGTGKFWQYDFSSVQGSAFIDIIYEKAQFDVNRDGSISIADVTTLVNKILGKTTN